MNAIHELVTQNDELRDTGINTNVLYSYRRRSYGRKKYVISTISYVAS